MSVTTFKDRFPFASGMDVHRIVAMTHPGEQGDLTEPSGNIRSTPLLLARVNASRWIVDCPDPGCAGAELANVDSGVFFCCSCRNRAVDHDYLPVALPSEQSAIEAALLARPYATTRNWELSETVADLLADNVVHEITI